MAIIAQLDPAGRVRFVPVLIPAARVNGLSDPIDLRGFAIKGIIMPPAWTAANITFQANNQEVDNGNYQNVVDSAGVEFTITAAAARYITFLAADHERAVALRFVKVRSGTSGTPVQQGADRYIILVVAMTTE